MKYALKEGFFGKYTLYVEQKVYDGKDPYDIQQYKTVRKATKEERIVFRKIMNSLCGKRCMIL